jgi:hypothetical protein
MFLKMRAPAGISDPLLDLHKDENQETLYMYVYNIDIYTHTQIHIASKGYTGAHG